MAFLGSIPLYDHKTSEWSIFKARLTQFLKINKIEDDNKGGVLLTHVSDETYRLIRNLAYPQEVETLNYIELVLLLDGHFKPKVCTFVDKANFYEASRGPGESLGDWAARLRGLASYCDFGAALETTVRDRFVLGLGPGPERDRLFEQSPSTLTLSRAIELAEQAACAKEAKMRCSDAMLAKEEPIYQVVQQTNCGRGGDSRRIRTRAPVASGAYPRRVLQQDSVRCEVCGMKNHNSEKCRYRRYTCQKCGKKGHLKKVCDKPGNSNFYHVESGQGGQNTESRECQDCQNFNLRYVADNPIKIDVLVGDQKLLMELDSGSARCVISECLYSNRFVNYPLEKSILKMCLYDGHRISPLGYFNAVVSFNSIKKVLKFFVVKNGGPPILGRDFMTAFHLVITCDLKYFNHDTELGTLLGKYPDLWRGELGTFNRFKIKLQLKENSIPKFFKARTVPFALKDKVEQELKRLVESGVLVSIDRSQYATPIVPVLKNDGRVKIAGDFSVTLNKDLVIEKYPMPRIEEVFAKIGGGDRYSKIDLKNAYNQFVLDDSSQELTTINTHKGLFKYTRLVYGLSNAPAIFQKSMETLLSGIDGVSIWLDDVCITGPDKTSHLNRLNEVLGRLSSAGLRLQKEKCEFFQTSVKYLGYVISKEGLQTSSDKVQAILNAPEPNNVTEVKRFLGLVNYYRNFIPNASSLMSPLHELLRKGIKWQWGDRQRRSMAAVRHELASERVLAHFEPSAQLVLSVDASPAGLGAVLAQCTQQGEERPIAYASRSLTTSERNYSQIQKEATAIIFGVKRFHQYLYGRDDPFILKTDHRPLVSIFNNATGIPVTTALRLQRYAIILSAYNYKVQYVRSDNNAAADFFSRAPLPCSDAESRIIERNVDAYYAINFLDESSPAVSARDIGIMTARDATLQMVVKYMTVGWPRRINCQAILPYFLCKSDLQFENGCLFRGHRIVIPLNLRDKMLAELHDSHLGIIKSKSNARSRMWWPGIDRDIERWIGSCEACASQQAAPPRAPPAPWPVDTAPWQRVHIDYMTIGQRVYLVVVDSFSKWLDCLYMHNGLSSSALISKLKYLFSNFGIPNVVVSDNDVKINSNEFRTFCNANGIKHMTSPIYHPPSNGQAENSVRTCKKMLRCIMREDVPIHKLHEILLGYLFTYRNTVHCTTGETPAKLMFGRNLRSRLDLILPCNQHYEHSEQTSISRSFEIGDTVWVRWYSGRNDAWRLGTIRNKIGHRMYNVLMRDLDTNCIRHVDQIRKFTGRDLTTGTSTQGYQGFVPPVVMTDGEGAPSAEQNLLPSETVQASMPIDFPLAQPELCVRGGAVGVGEARESEERDVTEIRVSTPRGVNEGRERETIPGPTSPERQTDAAVAPANEAVGSAEIWARPRRRPRVDYRSYF